MKKGQRPANRLVARVGGWIARISSLYQRLLRYFVYHLKTGMLVSVGMVAIFAVCCLSTNMVLIPEMDQGTVSISVSMPIGSEGGDQRHHRPDHRHRGAGRAGAGEHVRHV